MNRTDALELVSEKMIGATNRNLQSVASAASTIAAICAAKEAGSVPLAAGDKDVLPALLAAIGNGMAAARDLHKAQLGTFQIAKRAGLILSDSDYPSCESAKILFRNQQRQLAGNEHGTATAA